MQFCQGLARGVCFGFVIWAITKPEAAENGLFWFFLFANAVIGWWRLEHAED